MAVILIVDESSNGPDAIAVPLLRCDACGETRLGMSLTIPGELHSCAALGAFRLTGDRVLVRIENDDGSKR